MDTPKRPLVVFDQSSWCVARSRSHTPMPEPSIPSRKRSFRIGSSDAGWMIMVTFSLYCRAGLNDTKMPGVRPAAYCADLLPAVLAAAPCNLRKAANLYFPNLPQFVTRLPAYKPGHSAGGGDNDVQDGDVNPRASLAKRFAIGNGRATGGAVQRPGDRSCRRRIQSDAPFHGRRRGSAADRSGRPRSGVIADERCRGLALVTWRAGFGTAPRAARRHATGADRVQRRRRRRRCRRRWPFPAQRMHHGRRDAPASQSVEPLFVAIALNLILINAVCGRRV